MEMKIRVGGTSGTMSYNIGCNIINESVNLSIKISILDLYLHYNLFICQNIIVKLTGIS